MISDSVSMAQRIILASASEQRKRLLTALNLPYESIAADIDESVIRDPDPKKQAVLIARAKAASVAEREQGIIIAADTFGVLGNTLLEKPRDQKQAAEMLASLSGSTAMCYTGFCYLDRIHGIDEAVVAQTEFTLRKLSTNEIARYVEVFPVTRWAAALSFAYPYGMTLISSISGSFTGFTHGLPMELLIPLLARSGITVKP